MWREPLPRRGDFIRIVGLRARTMPFEKLRKADVSKIPPELSGRAVIVPEYTVLPVFRGAGNRNFGCGGCGLVLVQGFAENQHIAGLVIQCPKCKTYNEVDV